ncbi:hypothetical protein Cpir12675_006893 [Ceratocystis pirilliformis]|uniref:Acyltransferase 3 domain-containing protein n=1 Tax=Ceratocystis pirilliformis TaxID=259994 RepID=A0ABR3YE21_9PEZI
MAIGKEGNVKWVDGLRGIASALVVITHIARAFDHALFSPSDEKDLPARFLQWPMIRVLIQGRIGVTIFAFVTGYVCALKPIRLSRVGNQETAFVSMGKSALRRIPRLVIPTSIATIMIWVFAQLGVFHVAAHTNSNWLRDTAPQVSPYLGDSLMSLTKNLIMTWTHGANIYDANQWTLLPLLRCSMWIYAFMLGAGFMQPKYRMLASFSLFFFFWLCGDTAFGMPTFFGALMSDIQNSGPANEFVNNNKALSRILSIFFILASFWLGSYPEANANFASWSRDLDSLFSSITMPGTEIHRFSSCMGVVFLVIGLHFAPGMRDMLSNRYFLWLGKMSFAVYLLHGCLMRTALTWLVYGFNVPADTHTETGEFIRGIIDYPGHWHLFMVLIFWIPLNYVVAYMWTSYVDPWAARLTERMVSVVNIPRDEKPRLPA